MTTDTFTNADGTQIDTHDANWTATSGSQALSNATIQSNTLQDDAWRNVAIHYNGSQEGSSEIVLLANGSNEQRNTGATVGASTTQEGYEAKFGAISGSDYTTIVVDKNGAYATQEAGTWAISSNHTIKITATDNGSDVDINVWVDDVLEVEWTDTTTPLTGGYDGITFTGKSTAISVDNWTNGAAAGGSIIPQVAYHSNIILG